MGFSNEIYKYPKYKGTTPDQIHVIKDYYEYDSNDWAKKQYDSPEKYMVANMFKNTTIPTTDQIEFYKPFVHKDEYGYITISDTLYSECSNGVQLHHDIKTELGKMEDELGSVELDREDVIKLLLKQMHNLKNYKFEPAFVNHAFVYEDSDMEDSDIKLSRCDGIELTFDGDITKRIETHSNFNDYGTLIMTSRCYIDENLYNAQMYTIEALTNILETVDFDKECVFYSGGW